MRLHYCLVTAVISIHLVLAGWQAVRDSPTWDEIAHLPAGISHLELGRFELYRVNPPLARLVAAILPMVAGAETDWSAYPVEATERRDFSAGRDFIRINGERTQWLFTLARFGCLPFTLLGGLVCYCWARRLFGTSSGLVALSLWCLSPNILAWGHTIMPDVAATSCGAFLFFRFWIWLEKGTRRNVLVTGLALGLALASKGTWSVLLLLLPLIWLGHRLFLGQQLQRVWQSLAQLVGIMVLGLYFLNLVYAFDGSFMRLGDYTFVGSSFTGFDKAAPNSRPQGGNRFAESWVGEIPVPLPYHYLRGLDWIKWEFERGYPSYLRGEWRHGGWWYYYLYGLLIKVPLGCWGLLVLAGWAMYTGFARARTVFDEIYLLFPAIFILVLVSSQTGFGHHLRYVLPIFPFVIIHISRVAVSFDKRRPAMAIPATLFLGWMIFSSVAVLPHSMSYFNELIGGPANGYKHLLNSNIDFGQDLHYVKQWRDSHPDARPFFYSHSVHLLDPADIGLPFNEIPSLRSLRAEEQDARRELVPGWYAVGVNRLYSYVDRYPFLKDRQIDDRIGWSVLVFHLDAAAVEEICQKYDLRK